MVKLWICLHPIQFTNATIHSNVLSHLQDECAIVQLCMLIYVHYNLIPEKKSMVEGIPTLRGGPKTNCNMAGVPRHNQKITTKNHRFKDKKVPQIITNSRLQNGQCSFESGFLKRGFPHILTRERFPLYVRSQFRSEVIRAMPERKYFFAGVLPLLM